MKNYLKRFANAPLFDFFGVGLVVAIAIASGYLNTRLSDLVYWGSWTALVPFGLISVVNVGISMLSTRFTGKVNKWGNYLGIVNTILSGTIDYLLGNKAAILTYPITFIIYSVAIKKWQASQEGKPNTKSTTQTHLIALIATTLAFAFSYGTNYIGYGGHMNTLAYVTTIAFALSLVANVLNALKLTTQWRFWFVYNVIQLLKALIQGNFANLGKYIFYCLNAVGALFIWNDNERKPNPC